MRWVIPLGRIAGIPIGVNWTWLPIVALVIANYASDVFPSQNPGLSGTTYLVMAAVLALLFFGGLLMHELGHALVAKRQGMEIGSGLAPHCLLGSAQASRKPPWGRPVAGPTRAVGRPITG